MLGLLLRLAISMGVVMAVMGLAARFARRRQGASARRRASSPTLFGAGRTPTRRPRSRRPGIGRAATGFFGRPKAIAGEPPAEVLHRVALTKSAWAVVLAAGSKTLLIGVTEQRVQLLAELPSALGDEVIALQQDAGAADTNIKENWALVSPALPTPLDTPLDTPLAPPTEERPNNAWKLAIDSLRERTVRR